MDMAAKKESQAGVGLVNPARHSCYLRSQAIHVSLDQSPRLQYTCEAQVLTELVEGSKPVFSLF